MKGDTFLKKLINKVDKKEIIFIFVLLVSLAILAKVPTGFAKQEYINTEGVRGKILSVDNSSVHSVGIINQGDQSAMVEILSGSKKGEIVRANNILTGSLAEDKIFEEGETAWVLIGFDKNKDINFANLLEHYRIDKEIVLIALFAVAIIIFAGYTGVRTLLSFAFVLLSIWKVLIPLMLNGYNPIIVALFVGNILTIITILLVANFTIKAYGAIISSVSCSFITCILAIIFSSYFNVHGSVMQWSEALLYTGYSGLDLTSIFQAGIYLASLGAILDLAVDISSALAEIVKHNPDINTIDLVKSGLSIGKSVVGSQTTTLLFAYMGSYLSILMVYMAQGTPILNVLNTQTIASEILQTFVGCIGLVLVSPMTSIVCSLLYKHSKSISDIEKQKEPASTSS